MSTVTLHYKRGVSDFKWRVSKLGCLNYLITSSFQIGLTRLNNRWVELKNMHQYQHV